MQFTLLIKSYLQIDVALRKIMDLFANFYSFVSHIMVDTQLFVIFFRLNSVDSFNDDLLLLHSSHECLLDLFELIAAWAFS